MSFYVYSDGKSTVCMDSGWSRRRTAAGLRTLGVDPASVSHVFLTHSDFDHVGGLEAFPNARVLLPRAEEPMVGGLRQRRVLFRSSWNRLDAAWIPLDDGQTVVCGSIVVQAIATPGHTVGSMSYVVNDEALFTGDMIALRRGRACTSSRLSTEDVPEDGRSIAHLAAAVPAVALLCTAHSGYTTDYDRAMAPWRGA